MLIGGFAGVTYGSTLVTQDLDICTSISLENVVSLRAALADIHPRHRMNSESLDGVKNIYLETDLGILDIISEAPPAGDFLEIKKRATVIKIFGHSCKVISLDDLIKIKESMKRPKDIAALAELKIIRNKIRN